MKLSFFGGAGTVTGANFLLENGDFKLLVDCGLEQGEEFCKGCNYEEFAYDPSKIDVLIATHAHADHIGRIPKLIRDGFSGVVYSTPETKKLSEIMFADSVRILEMEAKREKKDPLYSSEDAKKALSLWKTIPYHEATSIGGGFSLYFKDAGHILGSAITELTHSGEIIVFTGDLGNSPAPILRDTEIVTGGEIHGYRECVWRSKP